MRVLDLDLDFFLADCCPLAEEGKRPALSGHEPWEEARVVAFLEDQCRLNARHPLPGRIFETHDQALLYWESLLAQGRLTAPFHVTHVDAHSDLGIGYPGPNYVLFNVLSMPPAKRARLDFYYAQQKLDEANYLLFALALRRVAALDNVRNPKSRPDLPEALVHPQRPECLQLTSLTAQMFAAQNGPEPLIPYHVYDDYRTFYASAPYDFVTLALSPRYAPKAADALALVIGRYIKQDP